MHFGKKKKSSSSPPAIGTAEALRTVKDSARLVQVQASDYKGTVAAWTKILIPSFQALDVRPPYFQNLFAELEKLTNREGAIGPLAHEALTEARKAEHHLAALRDKPKRRAGGKGKRAKATEKHADHARLAAAMVDAALREQIEALEREASHVASAGKLMQAQEIRERKLVYQHEQDKRRKHKRNEASADVKKKPKAKAKRAKVTTPAKESAAKPAAKKKTKKPKASKKKL